MSSLRNAIRALRASPLVSAVVILSLALGIGANAAMFSIVDALVLRDLPVRHAGRITMLFDDIGGAGFWSHPIWESIKRRPQLFDGSFAFGGFKFNLAEAGEVDPAEGLWASGAMFDVLGVDAVVGRTFSDTDDRLGGGPDGPVVVLSHDFWQRRFAGDRSIVGKTINLNRVPFTVIGVTGPRFFGPEVGRTFDVAVPINTEPLVRQQRSSFGSHGSWLQIVFRLKPGQTSQQATAAFRNVQQQIADETRPATGRPEDLARYLRNPMTVRPGTTVSGIRDQYDAPLLALMAIVGLTLLIACGNIANLLIARSLARRHEYSVRSALGASAARLGRQVFAESTLLALTGAALGIVVALVGSRFLVAQISSTTSRVFNRVFVDVGLDWRVIAFTAVVAILTTLIFGVGPALRSARVAPIDAMKEHGRALSGRHGGLASSLVTMQVALSLVLLVGAGLFVRTFMTLANKQLGFEPSRVLVAELGTDRAGTDSAARREMYQRMIESVGNLPGVVSASIAFVTPVSGSNSTRFMNFPGRPALEERERRVWINMVSRQWFTTLGMQFASGRAFDERDHIGSGRAVVVNEAFVRKYFADVNPIGMVIADQPGFPDQRSIEIVGVVRDAVYRSLREPVPPTMYLPIEQQVRPPAAMALMVRTQPGETAVLRQRIADAVVSVNANVTTSIRPLDDVVDAALSQERLVARLSAFFGVLALVLAALGLYGITSYSVTRRHTELGIRMALGTAPRQVAGLVLSNVAKLVALGLVSGALVSWWASRFIRGLLFELEPNDLLTMGAAAAVLAFVALLASWLPARRAARIDPAQVLRDA